MYTVNRASSVLARAQGQVLTVAAVFCAVRRLQRSGRVAQPHKSPRYRSGPQRRNQFACVVRLLAAALTVALPARPPATRTDPPSQSRSRETKPDQPPWLYQVCVCLPQQRNAPLTSTALSRSLRVQPRLRPGHRRQQRQEQNDSAPLANSEFSRRVSSYDKGDRTTNLQDEPAAGRPERSVRLRYD